jgi:hypothetical protein
MSPARAVTPNMTPSAIPTFFPVGKPCFEGGSVVEGEEMVVVGEEVVAIDEVVIGDEEVISVYSNDRISDNSRNEKLESALDLEP